MRPMAVVVLDVLVDHGLDISTTEDEHPVQTFAPDRADEALSEGVGTRCPDRSPDDPDAFGAEGLIEAGRELSVAIPDQKFDRVCTLGEFIGQVSGLLNDPDTSRIRRHTCHDDLSGVEFDEEQDIKPPEQNGVHGEEVTGQHRRDLDLQELTPRRPGSVPGRIDAVTLEDVPDTGWCQDDA